MKLAISITCFKRKEMLKQVLSSLEATNQSDISLKLFVSADFYSEEILSMIDSYSIDKQIKINHIPIGCNRNTLQAIQYAVDSKYSPYILHIEDDTPLAKDSLQYYKYAFQKYENQDKIYSVTGYNKTENLDEKDKFLIETQNFFCAWGCGFWSNKWTLIRDNWTKHLSPRNGGISWDTHINNNLFSGGKRLLQVKPKVSRIQNIGDTDGTYVSDPIWHFYHQRSTFTSDDYNENIDWKEYAKNN
jgi:hypothetical protein